MAVVLPMQAMMLWPGSLMSLRHALQTDEKGYVQLPAALLAMHAAACIHQGFEQKISSSGQWWHKQA